MQNNGRTPYVQAGTSYGISYSFGADAEGSRKITLEATSVESSRNGLSVMGSGEALFNVGTVGWLRTAPPSQFSDAMEISEAGDYYSLSFIIESTHPTEDQQVRTEVELENQYTIYRAWLDEEDIISSLKQKGKRSNNISTRSERSLRIFKNQ